jgi:D-glycero-D-manno-heptose 1,7-bisphosphate phosphatase
MAKLVVIDRDGTIMVDKHYLSDPGQVELLTNAAEGILMLRRAGFKVVMVTNQSGINRGYFDLPTLERIHQRLLSLLRLHGTALDAIYFCPHTPEENCACRKPEIGLLERVARDFDINLADIIVIGDNSCDIEMGHRVGAVTFLVTTGCGLEVLKDASIKPDYVVADVMEAAGIIVSTACLNAPVGRERSTVKR